MEEKLLNFKDPQSNRERKNITASNRNCCWGLRKLPVILILFCFSGLQWTPSSLESILCQDWRCYHDFPPRRTRGQNVRISVSLSRPIRTACPRHKEEIKIDRQLLMPLYCLHSCECDPVCFIGGWGLTWEPLSWLRARCNLSISLVDGDVIVTWQWPSAVGTM